MPIDYKIYPPNWKDLRLSVLTRAQNRCEFCGVENGSTVKRYDNYGRVKFVKVVLTTAHLDHDETNHQVSIDRLKALCQKCHINYDAREKIRRLRNKKNNIIKNTVYRFI